MQGKLQQIYRVAKELGQNSHFEGSLELSQLPRLSSLVIPDDAEIRLKFEFTARLFDHPSISGHVETQLKLECQRCLEPMVLPIAIDFNLLIDASDEDVQAYQMETVYSDDGYLDLYGVIEDELILALPLISMHEEETCNTHWQPAAEPEVVVKKDNPFLVLKSLKEKT
jgi:uncharacterized protein